MKKLTLERKYNAPIEKIWEAFTNSEILEKWWSPEGMLCSYVSIESIQEPNLISYIDTFADKDGNGVAPKHYGMPGDEIQESLIQFRFSTVKGATLMNVLMDNHYDDSMTEEMVKGWNGMFDKLSQLIET